MPGKREGWDIGERLECLLHTLRPQATLCLVKPNPLAAEGRNTVAVQPTLRFTALDRLLSSFTCISSVPILTAAKLFTNVYYLDYIHLAFRAAKWIPAQGHTVS